VYGYLNGVRSSRELEREANRNVEVMWLLGKLTPDFKTISDFRRDNGRGIREACRQLTLLCRDLDLFGGELVAIDGSKFKAVISRERNFTRRKLSRKLQRIDDKIGQYLQELDKSDEEELDTYQPTAEELEAKIETLKKRRQGYQGMQDQMRVSFPTSPKPIRRATATRVCMASRTSATVQPRIATGVLHDVPWPIASRARNGGGSSDTTLRRHARIVLSDGVARGTDMAAAYGGG
jgi:hypothetical protein